MTLKKLIEALKAGKTCAYCDSKAVKTQDGKPVCGGHAKGGSGC